MVSLVLLDTVSRSFGHTPGKALHTQDQQEVRRDESSSKHQLEAGEACIGAGGVCGFAYKLPEKRLTAYLLILLFIY